MKASEIKNTSEIKSNYKGNGIYVKKAKILSVEDLSNNPLNPKPVKFTFNSGFQPEMCLKVNLLYEGKEEPIPTYLFANYLREKGDKNGKVIGWKGRNNPILDFGLLFYDDFDVPDNFDIPKEILMIKDVNVWVLSYCVGEGTGDRSGKADFATWDRFEKDIPNEDMDDVLVSKFLSVAEYYKNRNKQRYNPEFYEEYLKMKSENNDNSSIVDNTDNTELPF